MPSPASVATQPLFTASYPVPAGHDAGIIETHDDAPSPALAGRYLAAGHAAQLAALGWLLNWPLLHIAHVCSPVPLPFAWYRPGMH